MTLILDLDLHILKMYLRTRMTFVGQSVQKLKPEQDRHTDRQTDAIGRIITLHSIRLL